MKAKHLLKTQTFITLIILSLLCTMINITAFASENNLKEAKNTNHYILTEGSYDEDDPSLIYTGSWNTASSSNYGNNAIKYSNEIGSSVEFTFEGSAFEWYGTKGNVRGGAEIYIDDIYVTTISCYNYPAQYNELLYRSNELSYGIHKVKITSSEYSTESFSYHNIDVDNIVILDDADSNIMQPGTYQNDDNKLYYANNWVTAASDNYDKGTIKVSRSTNSYVEFTFNGTAFEWYGTKANVRGKANIYIDDKLVTNDDGQANDIDCYASPTQYKSLIYRSTELSRGTHKVKIISTGEKDNDSSTSDIDIDKIVILKNINRTILKPGTYENTNNSFVYYGNWASVISNNYSSKNITVARNTNDSVEFTFSGSSFEWYGTKANIRGCARIIIDDKEIPFLVDCYSPSTLYNELLYKSSDLEYGVHTVKISASGLKSDSSSNIDIDVDRVVIN